MNIAEVKQWRDTAEVRGKMKYCDEVNWLISEVERFSNQKQIDRDDCLTCLDTHLEAKKKLEESYKMLRAAFDANADETITLRARFEELWRVKISLENDVARLRDALMDGVYICHGCEVPCRLDTCGKPFDMETAGCHFDGNMTGTNWKVAQRKAPAESV